jgi:hypothetical protein
MTAAALHVWASLIRTDGQEDGSGGADNPKDVWPKEGIARGGECLAWDDHTHDTRTMSRKHGRSCCSAEVRSCLDATTLEGERGLGGALTNSRHGDGGVVVTLGEALTGVRGQVAGEKLEEEVGKDNPR